MKAAPADTGLTFDWPERESFPFVLFACVLLSLLAHATTFVVFQVVYPQRVTIPPPPPQVSLLTASSPENEALLRWIAAEDPALAASAPGVVPPALLAVPYRPSFATARTPPLGSVEAPAPVKYPPARNPLAIIASASPHAAPEPGASLPMRTTLEISPAISDRGLKPPTFVWKDRASQPLQPLRALIGVNARGDVRFTFLQRSSGADSIDTEALAQLARLSFGPASAEIAWGVVTVDFGAEAYTNTPAELRRRERK